MSVIRTLPAVLLSLCAAAGCARAGERLVVGFGHIPPATIRGAHGQVQGFAVDVLREAASREGLRLEWRVTRGSRDAEEALQSRAIDLFPTALDTPDRRARFFLSSPWWYEDMALLTREAGPADEQALEGKRIALATALIDEAARRIFPQSIIITPESGHDGTWFASIPVCQGTADGALMTHRDVIEVLAVRPPECAAARLALLDTKATIGVTFMTRWDTAAVARRLRSRIDQLTTDGTLTRIAAAYPGIPATSATALAERIRLRGERRALIIALIATLTLLLIGGFFWLRSRRIQTELKLSENRYRGLFESIQEGFHLSEIICDDSGKPVDWRFLAANAAFESMTGRKRDEVVGRRYRNVFPESDCNRWVSFFGEVALTGKPQQLEATDIGHHWHTVAYSPRKGQFAVLFSDNTGRKHAEEHLRQSNEALEAFAYSVSHDRQEPLRMVTAYVDLLGRRFGDSIDPRARELMTVIRTGALRMTGMLQDMLQFSRAGRDTMEQHGVDCGEAVRAALETLSAKIDKIRAEIVVGPLPVVFAWPGGLVQVFQNLLENALKYSRPDVPPRIEITAEPRDTEWAITVSDNGIGMNMRYAERIFRVFQRLHGRGQYSGNGIGLAICKRIVERHGGRIWVAWSEPGQGTRFCFTLPAASDTPATSGDEHAAAVSDRRA